MVQRSTDQTFRITRIAGSIVTRDNALTRSEAILLSRFDLRGENGLMTRRRLRRLQKLPTPEGLQVLLTTWLRIRPNRKASKDSSERLRLKLS